MRNGESWALGPPVLQKRGDGAFVPRGHLHDEVGRVMVLGALDALGLEVRHDALRGAVVQTLPASEHIDLAIEMQRVVIPDQTFRRELH